MMNEAKDLKNNKKSNINKLFNVILGENNK
jgi:hypothetical protein